METGNKVRTSSSTAPNEDLTDVESLGDTIITGNSSTTGNGMQLGSETDYDDAIDELLDTQYLVGEESKSVGSEKNVIPLQESVQSWMDNSMCQEKGENAVEGDSYSGEDIQKMAAALSDAVIKEDFDAAAWGDYDQTVPIGDFKTNFAQDSARRLPLQLMNIIKGLCTSTEPFQEFRVLLAEILRQAVLLINKDDGKNLAQSFSVTYARALIEKINLNTLMDYRGGEYFTEISLRFNPKTVSRNQRPLIQAVENAVTLKVFAAQARKNAEIFSDFEKIPEIVNECNKRKSLGYSPDQVAKYSLRLQKAVFSLMVYRCLSFLASIGFPLKPEFYRECKENLMNTNGLTMSSQGSNADNSTDSEGPSSAQESLRSASEDELAVLVVNEDEQNDQYQRVLHDLQNSPGFQEVVRANFAINSPGGSMGSWSGYSPALNSYENSLPERERSPIIVNEYNIGGNMIAEGENLMLNSFPGQTSSVESGGSHGQEPARRRRRVE